MLPSPLPVRISAYAGWSGVIIHLKYLHYFGNESNGSLLEAYGIVQGGQQFDQLHALSNVLTTVSQTRLIPSSVLNAV